MRYHDSNIAYYKDNESDIYYALDRYSGRHGHPTIYRYLKRDGRDLGWQLVSRDEDEKRWWICHSNIYRPSKSSPYTIEELEKEGVPPVDADRALGEGAAEMEKERG